MPVKKSVVKKTKEKVKEETTQAQEPKVLSSENKLLLTEWQKQLEKVDESATHPYQADEEEANFAKRILDRIGRDLMAREQPSPVFNNMPYTQNYEYNVLRAQAFSPAKNVKNKNDKNISVGLEHEKIISLTSILLSKTYARDIKVTEKAEVLADMGDFLNLGIEHSYQKEDMQSHLEPLIYYQTNAQGDCFVFNDFVVKNIQEPIKAGDGSDFTYEELDNMNFDNQKYRTIQTRKIESKILDGRSLIPGNPQIESMLKQPRITLEFIISREEARGIFGSMKRWQFVPKNATFLSTYTTNVASFKTLFNTERIKSPLDQCVIHMMMDKDSNLFNIYVNGLQMLDRRTPFTFLYPDNNFPVAKFSTERVTGSFYAKPLPQKVKYNANFFDWVFKMMAVRFERGADPAWISKGKNTVPKNMFDAGNVTHGIDKDEYTRADPEQKGVTAPDINFFNIVKEILESQTINPTVAGQVSGTNTLGEVQLAATAQTVKLAYMFAGIMQGWYEMALIRSGIIMQRYTQPVEFTMVDGKKVPVYNDFSVIHDGTQNLISFDGSLNNPTYNHLKHNDELFTKAFKEKEEKGSMVNFYNMNPDRIRSGQFELLIKIIPKDIETPDVKLAKFFNEMGQAIKMFPNIDFSVLEDIYKNVSGRPNDFFKPFAPIQQQEMALNTGAGADGGRGVGNQPVPKPGSNALPITK